MRRSCFRPVFPACVLASILVVSFLATTGPAFGGPGPVKIGVLAYRGDEEALRMWSPTADYLASMIPEHSFSIVPLDFREIGPAVGRGEVDFILANTSIYVELEAVHGVSRMATLKNRGRGGGFTVFGGVIFCRAERTDISGLRDLKGRSFMGVDETSLGGWRVAWRELKAHGIDPYRDFKPLLFGDTHDAVVYAVLDRKVDAGTVRTDTIERMAEAGSIDPSNLRVLNPQEAPRIPFALSTRVYPEWPFARLRHTDDALAQKVVIALLKMPADGPAARAGKITGWTVPLDYEPVHALLKELRLGPYRDYGRITLSAAVRQYWYWIVAGLTALLCMATVTVYVFGLNRRLTTARRRLEEARESLAQQVQERTADLRTANEGLSREIEEHKKAEEKFAKSEEFIRNILNSVDDGFIVVDRDYRILTVNSAYCRQVGRNRDEVIGGFCYELSHRIDRPCHEAGEDCAVRKVFETGEPHSVVHQHPAATGDDLYVENSAYPLKDSDGRVTSVIEVINNITEKRLLEQERLKSQKLEAIGSLAGGIAHDFNNLLQGVFGYISLAKLASHSKERSLAALTEAEKALQLSVKLTNQLLTFSKGGLPVRKPIVLRPVIESAAQFALSGSRSDCRMEIADDLWRVNADEGQLAQVIQNLVLNADQAMPDGGRVAIRARNVLAPDRDLPQNLQKGSYVEIAIADSGIGIPDKDLPRIFDPYFTTKETGSGLGLATSYSIMKNHDGVIDVRSEVGRGTTFRLYLPATARESSDEHAARSSAAGTGRIGRILVMDDEPIIRHVAGELLRGSGNAVDFAEHGREAVEKYRSAQRSGKPFDVVILDLTIRGGMGGAEAMRRLLEFDPGVRAIVSSGYSDDPITSNYEKLGFKAYLKKPYDAEDLQAVVNRVLNS